MNETLAQCLAATLRTTAQAYAAGDQVAPCSVLWTDPERLWESVVQDLQPTLLEYRAGLLREIAKFVKLLKRVFQEAHSKE